jgi:hypothetical protein
MSALATIVGGLGELSESELRQLYLMVGVRLGFPDGSSGSKTQKKGGGKTSNAKPKPGKTKASASSSKGNPSRKSQWANHPLYQEYSRLKKVVENQSKEANTSFNAVRTPEARAYHEAFTRWVEAKHSFRGHGEGGQDRTKESGETEHDPEDGSEGEEEEEEEGGHPPIPSPTSPEHPKGASPPPFPGPSSITRGKPAKGKAKAN